MKKRKYDVETLVYMFILVYYAECTWALVCSFL